MAKRYLGGGVSFEQKDVYQEFSEDDTPTPSGSTTLAGLTDVDITNPTDGQTLVYDAASSKWVNGSGGGGGLIVNIMVHGSGTAEEYAIMDKTAGEIIAAINTGRAIRFQVQVPDPEEGLLEVFTGYLSSYVEVDLGESGTGYSFTVKRVGSGGDFYDGTYGCFASSSYPKTNFDSDPD